MPERNMNRAARVVAGLLAVLPAVGRAADTKPPEIVHNPCTTYAMSRAFEVRARITDESAIFGPAVHYRDQGEFNWKTMRLKLDGLTGDFVATVPFTDLRGTVEYFIEAFDVHGNGPAHSGSPATPHEVAAAAEAVACMQVPEPEPEPVKGVGLLLRLEPGGAVLIGTPQVRYYVAYGGNVTLKAGLGGDPGHHSLVRWLVGELELGWVGFPQKSLADSGGAAILAAGLRVTSPVGLNPAAVPYLEAHAGGTRTGPLYRFLYDVGLGLDLDVASARLGPFVRYAQIFDAPRPGLAHGDAHLVVAGVAVGINPIEQRFRLPEIADELSSLVDRDHDGVPDSVDKCPDSREDIDGFEDEDGCPEGDRNKDSDGDGVPDRVDQCPTVPGPAENKGCPWEDTDGDGITDNIDQCPYDPGPRPTGCPVKDRDGDGIPDDVDQCPDIPGLKPTGCPKKVLVVKTADKIEIKQQINFAFNKAKIIGRLSFDILDQVAAVFKSNPTIKVMIEGHTDDVGKADYNLKLSDARAHAVMQALIERGVDSGRLSAIGYGRSKPIASNRTARGRATNRRVEFKIVGGDEPQPTETPPPPPP